jgi:hypothetical protein
MKVTGFSFIRNATRYDYPILEAIKSILPLCNEFVIAVGNSEDNTLSLIETLTFDMSSENSAKIKIIQTKWDESLRKGGKVLAVETDKAFNAISDDTDWCFYIQGDEVVHEKYLPIIRQEMEKNLYNKEVEGLLFKYLHFYGSYNYIANSRNWYRNEVRIVRNNKQVKAYKDAQGFRKNNKKLSVKLIEAYIYHYGWVKNPSVKNIEQEKNKFWHDDNWLAKNVSTSPEAHFDYSNVDSLEIFEDTHPKVMQERIKKTNWDFKFDTNNRKFNLKEYILYWIEQKTGWRIGEYRNFRKISV